MSATWTRRDCLRVGVGAGGALLLGVAHGRDDVPRDVVLSLWLVISPDGQVTLRSNAAEMGQGSTSALAQIVAEELEQPWGTIRTQMAPVEPQYFGLFNDYVTGGSSAVRGMFEKLRIAGATARLLLLKAAARHWSIDEDRCEVRTRAIVDRATQRTLGFGELAAVAGGITLAAAPSPRPRKQWRIIGTGVRRLDLRDKLTGAAIFGIDAGPRDARIATLRHAPRFGSRFTGTLPAARDGVTFVTLPGAVAAVAATWPAALRALERIPDAWTPPSRPADETEYRERLRAALDAPGEIRWIPPERHAGMRRDNDAAFARAARVLEARYETPLLAHACMEPMNASAHVTDGAATVWAPTQVPASLRRAVASALSLPESAVRIETTLIGGGFGRRLETDYGVQAALLARTLRQPVKLIWSREQDLRHDFFRQAAMARLRAAIAADGTLLAVRARLAALGGCTPGGMPSYPLPEFLVTNQAVPTSIPMGAWRSVEANHNTFFLESFLDEIAYATGVAPLAFRRRLLAERPRALRVLDAAVAESGMETPDAGRHFGVALCTSFGSLCAQVVEISVPAPRELRVHRVTCALDCGTAVNPDSVRAQVEGCVVMGLSAAMFERVEIREGAALPSNFHDYPVLRYSQTPEIRTVLLESPDEPIGGVGEPPLPPLAPALANALYAASGMRIRRLPLAREGWSLV